MTQTLPPIAGLKDQARRLRTALADANRPISHCMALETVAKQHGYKDWNTLAAIASVDPSPKVPFAVGQAVSGSYLAQRFTGRIHAVQEMAGGSFYKLAIDFDKPVDVVRFESFSALRKRINATVNEEGISPTHTSDGVPHLVIDR